MQVIADLEVHSKYARAVSPSMDVPTIADWADKKGINLVGTGDFTHPMWLRELEANLEEDAEGIYRLKSQSKDGSPLGEKARFLLTSEVSCMYKHGGKGRRVHIMIYMPSFESVKKFNTELTAHGANLFSDGRPIMGLSLAQVAEIAYEANEKALVIPAHVWTPWFGFYGSMSGYDSLMEAFGDLEKKIPAVETGLSSDPVMNWRIAELTDKRIVSFGDAHSPQKLGREATVFEMGELSYDAIGRALWGKGPEKIAYTIEFYPEEGKYHYTGHRKCSIAYSPDDARKMGMTCPVCGRALTVGVMSRVETLASLEVEVESEIDSFGVRWITDKSAKNPSYIMLVPLLEILAESLSLGVSSKKVMDLYELLVSRLGSEFSVLLKTPLEDIAKIGGHRASEAIQKVRSGDIVITPGFDGVFGTVKIWPSSSQTTEDKKEEQTSLF